MAFAKGDTVKQVVPVIAGTIKSKRFNEDSDSFEFLVSYKDSENNTTERWFTASEIEAA